MIAIGLHAAFHWLVSAEHSLEDLLRICPEIVLGKYIAVTSFDSGLFVPTQQEQVAGWNFRGHIAYSPRVDDINILPRDQYDEWHIFNMPVDLGQLFPSQSDIFQVPPKEGLVCP